MSLQETIQADLKVAMKSKDAARTSAIRVLIGEFQRQLDKSLSDEQVVAIIKKMIKSEKELLASAGKETSDFLAIMEEYQPGQASEDEVKAWVAANIDFSAFKNKMQAMRPIITHFGSSVDGNMVKQILEDMN